MCCGDNKGLSLASIKKGALMLLWSHQLKPLSSRNITNFTLCSSGVRAALAGNST
nr:MAG TPA: hypothetical protein [Bacteriophage sp.]